MFVFYNTKYRVVLSFYINDAIINNKNFYIER